MDTQNPQLVILPVHMDLPCANEPSAQQPLQECAFRMHLATDDPQAPMVHISGGISCTAGRWQLFGYFGPDHRQYFSVPLDPSTGSGELAQMLTAVLPPA